MREGMTVGDATLAADRAPPQDYRKARGRGKRNAQTWRFFAGTGLIGAEADDAVDGDDAGTGRPDDQRIDLGLGDGGASERGEAGEAVDRLDERLDIATRQPAIAPDRGEPAHLRD